MPTSTISTPLSIAGSHRNEHFPAFDGVRGMAVLMVLFDHASDSELRFFPDADLSRLGKYGVYLFFVLSAFLLTYPFFQRRPEELRSSRLWLEYFLRRFLRIYPLYAFLLAIQMIRLEFTFQEWVDHLLLREGQKHFWTIPVEFKFYLVLPLFIAVVCIAGRKNWLVGLFAALLVVLFLQFAFFPAEAWWSMSRELLLSRNLAPFLLGAMAAGLYTILRNREVKGGRFAWSWDVIAACCISVILFRIPSIYNFLFPAVDMVSKFGDDEVVCGIIWSLFLIAVLQGSGLVRSLFEWLPLRYIGWVSYSAYLLHRKFLSDVDNLPVPSIIRLGIYLLVVIGAASITYWLIERPLSKIRLRRRRADSHCLP